jgi:hypothetical protein
MLYIQPKTIFLFKYKIVLFNLFFSLVLISFSGAALADANMLRDRDEIKHQALSQGHTHIKSHHCFKPSSGDKMMRDEKHYGKYGHHDKHSKGFYHHGHYHCYNIADKKPDNYREPFNPAAGVEDHMGNH